MRYCLYAVEDVCAGFGDPVTCVKEELAKREFINRCKKSMNPEDMRLYRLGSFETETGEIFAEKPELILKGEPHE